MSNPCTVIKESCRFELLVTKASIDEIELNLFIEDNFKVTQFRINFVSVTEML